MSVLKDESGRRYVQVEVEVPGKPQEVWLAVATGPGVSSWFVPTEIREDGTIISCFGPGMEAVARRTLWEPPHRFAAEGEGFSPDAPPLATEWTVEARPGGTCMVRVVHSLAAANGAWDRQLESAESGWPWFFQILRVYLTHYAGQPCGTFRVMGMAAEPESGAWETLTDALGLKAAVVGQPVRAGGDAPSLAGVVDHCGTGRQPHRMLLRLSEPAPGVVSVSAHAMGAQVFLVIDFYLYGSNAEAVVRHDEPAWQAWMKNRFPGMG